MTNSRAPRPGLDSPSGLVPGRVEVIWDAVRATAAWVRLDEAALVTFPDEATRRQNSVSFISRVCFAIRDNFRDGRDDRLRDYGLHTRRVSDTQSERAPVALCLVQIPKRYQSTLISADLD